MKIDNLLSPQFDEIRALAIETLGFELIADYWLNSSNHSLGCTPMAAAQTKSGANEVRKILKAIGKVA